MFDTLLGGIIMDVMCFYFLVVAAFYVYGFFLLCSQWFSKFRKFKIFQKYSKNSNSENIRNIPKNSDSEKFRKFRIFRNFRIGNDFEISEILESELEIIYKFRKFWNIFRNSEFRSVPSEWHP